MPTANEDILDRYVRHIHWLERYKSGEVRRIVGLLNAADRDLVERILLRLDRIGRGDNLSKAETERLQALLLEIRNTKKELSYALYEEARAELTDFASQEADLKAGMIETAAAVELTRPSFSQLKAVVTARPFQGRILREWYEGLGEGQGQRISDAIRIGITEGQTTDQIIRRIRGTRALRYTDGILEIGRRETAAVVRTAIAHVSNKAAEELYFANDDVIQGVQWISTLDGRTTTICASRDGKVYKVGQGPRPPAHWNCRSTTIPYLGVNAGTRASSFGPVPRSETYETWLRKQSSEFQNDVLGKSRANLFRYGGLGIERFFDLSGKFYNLDELRQQNKKSFDKAFGAEPAENDQIRKKQEEAFKEYLGSATYGRMKSSVEKINPQGATYNQLSEAEQIAVHAYTHGDKYFERLNAALRSDSAEDIARVSPMANILDNAIDRLPKHEGTVFRVTDLPEEVAKGIVEGAVFTDKAFLSASKADLGKAFGATYRFTMVNSKKSREISGLSAYKSEQEVLFPRKTRFDIISVEADQKTGFIEVLLHEQDV